MRRSKVKEDLCTLSEQSKLQKLPVAFPQHTVSSVWQVHTVVLRHPTCSLTRVFFPPAVPPCASPRSGAAVALRVAKEGGPGGQGRGGGGVGGGGRRRGRGSGGAEEGGVRAHLLDVDVGGVEQDVVLPAEAGEDGGDARHQLGESGPALGLGVPALDHQCVAGGEAGGGRGGGVRTKRRQAPQGRQGLQCSATATDFCIFQSM